MDALLTIESCAEQMGCKPLAVKRLIARGRLSAADLGSGPRVLPAELQRYVGAGAPDFKADVASLEQLIGGTSGASHSAFAAFREAMRTKAQKFDHDAAKRLADLRGTYPTATITITPGEAKAIMDSPSSGFPQFQNLGDALFANRLARELQNADPSGNVARLYKSPGEYQEAVKKASEAVAARSDFESLNLADVVLRVECPVSAWADPARVARVAKLVL